MPATMNRNTARTMSAMTPASMPASFLLLADERRGALDLDHMHALPRLDDLVLVVGARPPGLALQLHAAAVLVVGDALGDQRGAAHQRGGARAQLRRLAAARDGDRPQRDQQGDGDDEGDDPRRDGPRPRRGDDGG